MLELLKADFKACGAGRGAECCKFLVAGIAGAECARGSCLEKTLLARTDMIAQRVPTQEYPSCQIFKEENNER